KAKIRFRRGSTDTDDGAKLSGYPDGDSKGANGCLVNFFEGWAWLMAVTVNHGERHPRAPGVHETGLPLVVNTTQSFITMSDEAVVCPDPGSRYRTCPPCPH